MAYMSQEKKKALAPAIKACLAKHGVNGSLSVDHHSSLILTIKSGSIDFFKDLVVQRNRADWEIAETIKTKEKGGSLSVNHYHYKDHFEGKSLAFLSEVIPLMMIGNHDRSDIQSDYFDVGWYIDIHVGRWNKPYELITDAPYMSEDEIADVRDIIEEVATKQLDSGALNAIRKIVAEINFAPLRHADAAGALLKIKKLLDES